MMTAVHDGISLIGMVLDDDTCNTISELNQNKVTFRVSIYAYLSIQSWIQERAIILSR